MKILTVSLFGHREIDDLRQLNEQITPLIRDILQADAYVVFLIGRNGEFDEHVASVIKVIQKEVGTENSEIALVLPYTVADLIYYEA